MTQLRRDLPLCNWRKSPGLGHLCLLCSVLAVCQSLDVADSRGASASAQRVGEGNPPASASADVVDAQQAGFKSPVNNFGALSQQIPIPLSPGIAGLTPELSLVYSSRGGIGAAGVGWDLPLAAVSLNPSDGSVRVKWLEPARDVP